MNDITESTQIYFDINGLGGLVQNLQMIQCSSLSIFDRQIFRSGFPENSAKELLGRSKV